MENVKFQNGNINTEITDTAWNKQTQIINDNIFNIFSIQESKNDLKRKIESIPWVKMFYFWSSEKSGKMHEKSDIDALIIIEWTTHITDKTKLKQISQLIEKETLLKNTKLWLRVINSQSLKDGEFLSFYKAYQNEFLNIITDEKLKDTIKKWNFMEYNSMLLGYSAFTLQWLRTNALIPSKEKQTQSEYLLKNIIRQIYQYLNWKDDKEQSLDFFLKNIRDIDSDFLKNIFQNKTKSWNENYHDYILKCLHESEKIIDWFFSLPYEEETITVRKFKLS